MNYRRYMAMVWMILGIPVWCFTEEGPVGYVAGKLTDWWIETADRIDPSR